MRALSLGAAIAGLLCLSAPGFAQRTPPADRGDLSRSEGTADTPADHSEKTLEELVEEGYALIQIVESRGPDSEAAFERLQPLIGEIRSRDPINADADFLSGRLALVLGRPRKAIELINKYARSRSGENDWLAFKLLGDLYVQAKYPQGSRDQFQRAVDLNPRSPEACAGMAEAELALARPHKAVEWAEKAIRLDTDKSPRFFAVLARALVADGKPQRAAEEATAAVNLARALARQDPTNPAALAELDAQNELLENTVQALLEAFPERIQEFARLARVQRERADIAHLLSLHRVLEVLERGIEQSAAEVPPELILERARLLVDIGNDDEAVGALTGLLERDPEHAEARALLQRIRGPASPPTAPP